VCGGGGGGGGRIGDSVDVLSLDSGHQLSPSVPMRGDGSIAWHKESPNFLKSTASRKKKMAPGKVFPATPGPQVLFPKFVNVLSDLRYKERNGAVEEVEVEAVWSAAAAPWAATEAVTEDDVFEEASSTADQFDSLLKKTKGISNGEGRVVGARKRSVDNS